MLKLYHRWGSTCSKRVRIALAEKNIEWEGRIMSAEDERQNLESWYIELNPNGVVPTIDHDGRILYESCVILEYLEDVFPDPSLRPEDPLERAMMRIWLDKAETVLHKNINIISHNARHSAAATGISDELWMENAKKYPKLEYRAERMRRGQFGISAEEEAHAEAVLAELMDEMEAALSKHAWLAGKTCSLADISVTPYIERFAANGLERLVDWSIRPAVGDWWGRMIARPAYAEGMQLDRVGGDGAATKKES